MNSPADHEATATSVAHLTGSSVLGVFNRSGLVDVNQESFILKWYQGDLFVDLLECAQDWAAIAASSVGLKKCLSLNKSIAALYYLLRLTAHDWPSSPVVIIAHSQGNLVAANALFMYSHIVTKHNLKRPKIHVVGLASPAPSWPTNDFISVKLFSHLGDVVPCLGFGRSGVRLVTPNNPFPITIQTDAVISDSSLAHGADSYLDDETVIEHLWEVLKTSNSTRANIKREIAEQQKRTKAEEAAAKTKQAESMAKFIRYSDFGPKY